MTKKVTGTLLIAGLLVLVGLWVGLRAIEDETAVVGGQRALQEPMRPAGEGPRVLLIALDGVGREKLETSIAEGYLPSLAEFFGPPIEDQEGAYKVYEQAVLFEALSVLPSTTMAAWTSVFTGAEVGEHGVTGNEWYDRESRRFFAPGPVIASGYEDTLAMLNNDLLGEVAAVPSLYELADVRSYVSLAPMHRGADLFTMPAVDDVVALFEAVSEGVRSDHEVEQEAYREIDRQSVNYLLEAIEEHGLADLQVVYFPGVDLYTHLAHPPMERMRNYLREVIDPALARIFDAYERRGALEETYVVLVSDHGHTAVHYDEAHALSTSEDDGPGALIEAAGYRLRDSSVGVNEEEDYQVVMASQGAIAYLYVADRSSCEEEGEPCDWSRVPRLTEDLLPLARAFYKANEDGERAEELQDTLEMVLVRVRNGRDGDKGPFAVFDGEGLVELNEYLEADPHPHLLQFSERIAALGSGAKAENAGDILLVARSGESRSIDERYYFSPPYHSWHGSAEASDSEIPLVVARQGASGAELQARLVERLSAQPSQLDVVPVVLHLLKK